MKKYIYAFATVVALCTLSCSKDTEIQNPDKPEPVDPIVPTEKSAVLTGNVDATKVTSDNNGIFLWQASDVITIITDNGNNREFTAEAAGLSSDFSGHIPNADELIGGYAIYPPSSAHEAADNILSFELPSVIKWNADASNMPMFSKIVDNGEGDPKASFKAIGGVLKLICYNIPSGATKLSFISASKKIAGAFLFDADDAVPTINGEDSSSDAEKTIVIDFSENYSSSKVFYIPLPVVTLTGGFTVKITDSGDSELFSITSSAAPAITRNKLMIAPALNCGAAILWSEDFSQYKKDDVPSGAQGKGYGGINVTYTSTNGAGSSPGTTKIYNENTAGIAAPELLVGKKGSGDGAAGGTFSASGIPTNDASSMVLTFRHKKTVDLTVSSGITPSETHFTTDGQETVTLTNTESLSSFDITFTASTTNNVRLDDIVLSFTQAYSIPTINVGEGALTIGVSETEATTNVSLIDPIDGLGVSYSISGTDADNFTAAIDGTTLTVMAKATNATAADKVATVTLKATGASNKAISVTQTSCLVPNPADLTAIAGDAEVDVTWTGDAHATSYVAYLHTAATATPAKGGTDITSSISNSGSNYSIADYSSVVNGQTYYLYIKVNGVASSYVAPTDFAVVSFTPAQAKGTAENPYLASEAYDIVSAYASGEGPAGTIYVKGYVSTASDPTSNYQTYYFSDDGSTTKQFQAYRGKGISGADITDANKVSVGDWVVVSGTAINYSGTTPEFSAGSTIYTHNPKLAAPEFTPAAGTYYSAQSVEISGPDGATIYYTVDGSDPTTSSSVYSEAISVDADKTIKAFAVKANCIDSDVAEAAFDIEAPTKLSTPAVNCTSHSQSALTFEWAAVANATKYQVSLNEGISWEDPQTTLSYTWTDLTASTSYTITVKACGSDSGQYIDSDFATCTQATDAPSAYSWKETALGSISSGDIFVIVGNNYAMTNNNGTSSAPDVASVTVTGDEITSVVNDNIKWNLTVSDGKYTFYPNGSSTTWLYCNTTASSSSNNNMRVGTGDRKYFIINSDGYCVTSDNNTPRYLSIYNNSNWRGYVNTNNGAVKPKFYKYTSNLPTYAITIDGSVEHGSVSIDPAGPATAGTSITLTATPAAGYVLEAWDVYKTGDSSTKVTVTSNSFTMPAYGVTVSATFSAVPTIGINKSSITGVAAAGVTNASESGVYSFYNGATDADVTVTCDETIVTAASKNNGALTYTVASNSGAARDGWIKVKYGTEDPHTITVSQLAGAVPTEKEYYKLNTTATPVGTSTSYSAYTNISCANNLASYGTYPSTASWSTTCGSKQSNTSFWLGSNSKQQAKMTLGNGSVTGASAIATALGVTTSATYYSALICSTNFANISKVVMTRTTPGGTAPSNVYLLYSTDNGITYTLADTKSDGATVTFTIANPVASARYAIVIKCSGYCQYKDPIITFHTTD